MKPGISWAVFLMVLIVQAHQTQAAAASQVCAEWKESAHVGDLQVQLKEASGVAASRRFPDRLYHINDSGDNGSLYLTDMKGANTRTVAIEGFRPADTEALSLGPCGGGKSCVFIGDIGDNDRKRQSIQIAVVEEVEALPRSVKPRQLMKLRYPDGPHDAESMAVHPNGAIFILTKESPARLYKANLQTGAQTMTLVQTFDAAGRATDMAISDDGTRMLVLTYLDVTEYGFDFVRFSPPRYRQKIPIQFLQQQEAVTYLPGSRSFIYTTEQFVLAAWIMQVDCRGK